MDVRQKQRRSFGVTSFSSRCPLPVFAHVISIVGCLSFAMDVPMTEQNENTLAFPALQMSRKFGDESFSLFGEPLDLQLSAFWQWSSSDLVSNAMRGVLAEFLVASALGLADGVRNQWDAL